jgi:hypothetical protein
LPLPDGAGGYDAMKCHRRLQQQYGKAYDNSHRRQAGRRKIKVPFVIQG